MKKTYLSIYMLFFLHALFGQSNLILDQHESGNVIKEAENSIRLAPGFSYSAVPGETFIARIKDSNADNNNLPDYNVAMNDIDQQPNFQGSIAGNLDVNALGGAVYTIPIEISPGTAGMQPNLAIVYNSQSGNGVLGLKWGLSVMSAISRVSKNTYYNNTIAEITYDATPYNDALIFDGNRLERLSDGTFMTRNETFAKITLSGSGTGAWFKVEHKNGQTFEYGNTSDSKLYASGKTNPIAWRLNKVTDSNGNYMQYFYTSINDESVLDKITYTGNSKTALPTYNTIQFHYKVRQDTESKYVAGGTLKQNNILTSIEIKCEGVKVKEIIFDYSESAVYSRLTGITEKFDENTSSSLGVTWGNSGCTAIKGTQANIKNVPSDQIFSGDFDGDGIDDILTYSNGQWKLSYGGGEEPVNITLTNQPSGLKVKATTIGDFNGDGKKDLILFGTGGSCSIYHFNNGTFNFIQNIGAQNIMVTDIKTIVGNFTDVFKDQLLIKMQQLMITSHYYILSFSNGQYSVQKQPFSAVFPSKSFPMNVNGDSYTDLGILEVNKLYVYDFKNNSPQLSLLSFPLETIFIDDIFVEDMNGDGLSDIINITSNTTYDIYYGQGNGSYTKSTKGGLHDKDDYKAVHYSYTYYEVYAPLSLNVIGIVLTSPISMTTTDRASRQCIVKDFNGDGKADLLEIMSINKPKEAIFKKDINYTIPSFPTFSPSHPLWGFDPLEPNRVGPLIENHYQTYLNISAEYKRTYFYLHITGENTPRYWEFSNNDDIAAFETIGDFNGDGQLDFLCKTRNLIYTFSDASTSSDFLVKSIKNNALGASTDINYTYASNKSVHTQGTESSFPYHDFAGPMPIVSSVESPDGIGGKTKTEYTYSGLSLHKTGRGMLGFKNMTAKNTTQGIQSTTHYKETDSALKTWAPYYTMTTTTDGTQISSIGKKYAYKTPAAGRTFGYDYIEADTVRNYLTNRYYYTISEYDNYGNATSSKTTYSQNGILQQMTNIYVTKDAWCPSKLETKTLKQTYNGSTHTKTTGYTYDNYGNLLTVTEYPGKAKALTATYVPNAYGLPVSLTLSASGQTSRVNSFVYDSKYRFLEEKKNELGQTVKTTYNAKNGKVLEAKNLITGLKTEMKYDAAGRMNKIIFPDGITTQVYVKKPDANAPQNAKYYILTNTQGSPYSKVYYDALGRAIKQEVQGYDAKVFIEKSYNAKGQLDAVSDPYTTSPSIYTNYLYDKFGRIEEIQNQSLITSYGYNGAKTTVTQAGKEHSETIDQLGNVVSATDDNGQILTYLYHGSGELSSVSNNNKILVSIGYDEYGRQQSMTDIDAGTSTYNYNAFGELVSQTDANGNTFTLQYDNLGRIQHQNSSTLGNTTYEYYTDLNKAYHGLLKSVSRTDNMQQRYAYNDLGRLITYTDVIQGEELKTKYGYDATGNVVLTSYPSGFTVENRYNNAGYLYDIVNVANSKSIWKLQETDAYGAVRKALNGNGLQTSYEYDSYRALTEIKTGNIQHLTYAIDPASHSLISERKDVKKNMKENFAYDNLNRMQSVSLNGGAPNSMLYSNNGNIDTKYDNGTYQYHNQKIHAVETVTGGNDFSEHEITYNALNKTSTIEQGDILYEFKYGTDGQRRKMQRRLSGTLNLDRTYSQNYLKETIGSNTRETHYIPTPTGVSAIFVKENGNAGTMYYLCSDHLGSITDVVNASGQVVESFSFDPWGRRRNASNWIDYNVNTSSTSLLSRGYTGHEHLDDVGLINMNGRMYDPLLGRMLSPDNLIPDPFSLQGYNRYSYVHNNPMYFIDPDGEFPWLAALLVTGFTYLYNAYANTPKGQDSGNPGNWAWNIGNWDTFFTINIGYNTGGDWTFSGGIGNPNNPIPVVGYNTQYGWGGGMSYNGSSSMYYPGYENKVNQAIDQGVNNAIENARAAHNHDEIMAGTLSFAIIASASDGPFPVGDIIGGVVVTTAYLYLYAPDLVDKMNREIAGIRQRVAGPPGFTYSLNVNNAGTYLDVRGNYVTLKKDDVWKYGETTQMSQYGRYSDNELRTMVPGGVTMNPLYPGNQMQIKIREKKLIYGYFFQYGHLPPGNSIFR